MPTNNSINATNPIGVASGGTGAATFTAYSVLTGGTTATGAFQNVSGVGTVDQVLTSAGAGAIPAWANPTIMKIQSQTANNSATIDFTTGIAAPYNNFILFISNYLPATNATQLWLRISTDGGANYINTNYESALVLGPPSSGVGYNSTQTSTTEFILMHSVNNTNYSSIGMYTLYDFVNGARPCINGNSTFAIAANANAGSSFGYNSNTTVNAIRLLSSSGNITTGIFTLYGIVG